MKKIFFGIMCLSAIFLSCTKTDKEVVGESGSVKLSLAFQTPSPSSFSANSISSLDAKPLTKWSSIKHLRIMLIDASGKVAFSFSKNVSLDDSAPLSTPRTIASLSNVPVGTYKVVALANATPTYNIDNVMGNWNSATSPWTDADLRYKSLSSLFMATKFSSNQTVSGVNQTLYNAPQDMFCAIVDNQTITTGENQMSLALKRDVSLLRIRVNRNSKKVSFANTGCSVKVHRTPTRQQVGVGSVAASVLPQHIILSGKTSTTNPGADTYLNGGTILVDNFSEWTEVIVFPSTTRDGVSLKANGSNENLRYSITLKGVTTENIGTTPAGTNVFYSGVISKEFKPNEIVELNVTLTTNGSLDEITDEEYGNCEILATVLNWGTVNQIDLEV